MPKTMGMLLREVRDRLDEAAPGFWTDEQLRKWINEGTRNVSRRSETLLTTTDIPVTAGTQQYVAPADAVRVARAEWRPTGQTTVYPLEYRDYGSMDNVWGVSQAITQGYPTHFTLWGWPPTLTLIVYPTPSVNGNVRCFYYRLAAELATTGTADATNVDVPEGWWDIIVDYAEYTALRKEGSPRWQEAKAQYEQRLLELMDNTRRWSDQAGSFEFAGPGGALPGWLVGGDW